MSRKTIYNCTVVKKALIIGEGRPLIENLRDKEYCQGYQKSSCDDEPYHECMNCHLNILNQSN